MTYSYTQISQYLACPRRYRYRYIDDWRERDNRASLLFGRVFEQAVAAYFRGQDCGDVLVEAWSAYKDTPLVYSRGDTWEDMLRQGLLLLKQLVADDRISIRQPEHDLQIKFQRQLSPDSSFVAYIDAIGRLDGRRCLMDFKTTSSRYPEGVQACLNLDPQLICYSWISGLSEVALVVFVRKQTPEIQYLRTTISEPQRQEFWELVEQTIQQIEHASFLPHSGVRFPQNGCLSCSYLGLCTHNQSLIEARLLERTGDGRDWLDQLVY